MLAIKTSTSIILEVFYKSNLDFQLIEHTKRHYLYIVNDFDNNT